MLSGLRVSFRRAVTNGWIAVIGATLMLLFGLLLEFGGHVGAFPRSGVVVILYAIVVAYVAFAYEEVEREIESLRQEGADSTRAERLRRRAHRSKKDLLEAEAALLLAGTSVWGFGDLLTQTRC